MTEWDTYVTQVVDKYDFDTNEVVMSNLCTAAAIYGHDGSCWAYTAAFPELTKYEFSVEGMSPEDITVVQVDEFDAVKKAGEGDRKPCGDAGMRLGNKKYMFVFHDETAKVTQLSCSGGGAAIYNINGASIIAIYDKNVKSSDDGAQSGARCAEQVGIMGAFLTESGY